MKSINRTKKVVNLGTRSIIDGQDVETGSTFEAVSSRATPGRNSSGLGHPRREARSGL